MSVETTHNVVIAKPEGIDIASFAEGVRLTIPAAQLFTAIDFITELHGELKRLAGMAATRRSYEPLFDSLDQPLSEEA